MSVQFQDYYAVLGVPRTASTEEIKSAYRRLARQFHPDMNKETSAAERFKRVSEAYEVLHDPERRKRYDELGADYKPGQEFHPPPGWENFSGGGAAGGRGRGPHGGKRRAGRGSVDGVDFGGFGGTGGGFSDFFETFFGGGGGGMGGVDPSMFGGQADFGPRAGADHEAEITISLRDAALGVTRGVSLRGSNGSVRSYEVKIPRGTRDGDVIRLSGQGDPGQAGGPKGNLLLKVRVAPDPRFAVENNDLVVKVPLAPWEAVLGAKVDVELLDGSTVSVSVPPGGAGKRLRIRGKGLARRGGEQGDVLLDLTVVAPPAGAGRERELWEELARTSTWKARP